MISHRLLCDTNIWYSLAFGELSISDLRATGGRVEISPITIIELLSDLTRGNFTARRRVARTIIAHSPDMLEDPEFYLCEVWGLSVPQRVLDWNAGLCALAESSTLAELATRMDFGGAHVWRFSEYTGFVNRILDAIEFVRPGYSTDVRSGRINISAPEKTQVLSWIRDGHVLSETLYATWDRVRTYGGADVPTHPSEKQLVRAIKSLLPYTIIYQKYLEKVATEYAPRPNDWGDLELFIYATRLRRVATKERKWVEILCESGLGDYVMGIS